MARVLLVSAILAAAIICTFAVPSPPVWPDKYTVHANFQVPYFRTHVPMKISLDRITRRQLVDYHGGMDTYTYRFDTGKLYFVFPRIDTPTCQVSPLDSSDSFVEILPKLDSKWVYKGHHTNGQLVYWEWKDVKYNFTNTYQFFVAAHTLHPVRLHMRGFNFVLGSHPDEYVIHYSNYRPNHAEESHFVVPPLCVGAKESSTGTARAYRFTNYLGLNMLSATNAPDTPNKEEQLVDAPVRQAFHEFIRTHKRSYSNAHEYQRRYDIFQSNLRMIEAHNARTDVTYKLGITQFADMEYEEIQRVMNPNKFRRQRGERPRDSNAVRMHELSGQASPDYVNWVEKGAVNPPKDQGACGSCWTFGTIGSLEGAWAIKTGKLLSLSEQQLLDCAWYDGGNSGCDGGFAGEAFNWIQSNRGLALEADYPYIMIDGYCKARIRDSGVRVNGHVNVTATENSLRDAVATAGPVAVAINAATPDFYYMQGDGIYDNPACTGGIDDLDHEVLVVGYGTDMINGKPVNYWLLKNSWGVIWGNKGFWKMRRDSPMAGGMCGVHQQGRYALV